MLTHGKPSKPAIKAYESPRPLLSHPCSMALSGWCKGWGCPLAKSDLWDVVQCVYGAGLWVLANTGWPLLVTRGCLKHKGMCASEIGMVKRVCTLATLLLPCCFPVASLLLTLCNEMARVGPCWIVGLGHMCGGLGTSTKHMP